MKIQTTLTISTLLLVAAAGTTAIAYGVDERDTLPPIPVNPHVEQIELVEAHPFTLSQPAVHACRAEKDPYTSGVVLVLQVRSDLLVRRQTLEPVLYVGDETADRVNVGSDSGYLIAIVPDVTLEALSELPIFFGTPELPERVTRQLARTELAIARNAGAQPAANLATAERDATELQDAHELRMFASILVQAYSPSETDLISGLQAPLLRR